MAALRCTPTSAATVRRQLIAYSTVLLFLADGRCFVADTDASQGPRERRLMQVENRHEPCRNLKSQDGETFPFAAVGSRSRKSSRPRASRGTSFTSQPIASTTSNDGVNASRLEVEALTAFKVAITGDPLDVLKSWRANDSTACSWVGVVCSSKDPKAVTALNLGSRQLVGHLNSALKELGKLQSLRRLDLSNNVFSGSIPGPALANCSNLSYFNVSYNELTGPIPFLVGKLVNLEVLDLKANNLSGEIPVTLGNCTSLTILDLGSNILNGEIPPVLGRLSRVQFLNLAAKIQNTAGVSSSLVAPAGVSSFSGSIPLALGNCSSLTYLDVNYNSDLGGELPQELKSLKSLRQLWLSFCNFQGALPTWLGNLTSLRELRLSYNHFYGDIPDVLGQLWDLRGLRLGGNNLSGVIPISITNCTRLTLLTVESNYLLTGQIPPQLGLLNNLEVLSLAINAFTGVIPTDIANCSALVDLELGMNPMDSQIIPLWMGSLTNLSYLYLARMNLRGGIPKEIGKLSNLQQLILFDNNLSGVIPSSLTNCTSLTSLDFGDNKLTGEIPSDIGLLVNLTYIRFKTCFLTGSLPASIVNLTRIETFMVQSNSLNGTLGIDFGRLSQLQKFHAEDNHFHGPTPKALSNCSNLFEIAISANRLTGEIPASFGNLTRLEQLLLGNNRIGGMVPAAILRCFKLGLLDLEFNKLEGKILANIGQLYSLRVLRLADNHFFGDIPSSLGNCSAISVLDLSYNRLTGNLPGDIFLKLSSLTSLNLSHNFFSGSWPQQLSQLTVIQIIDISANSLSGSIPSSLEKCKTLVKLDISINNLTGVIPPSLGSLPALAFLNASYNDFEGPVPDSGVFSASLTDASFMGNPRLCGIILGPHRECLASSTSRRACKSFNCKRVWIPTICAGAGFVCIVAAVLSWVNTLNEARKSNKGSHLMLNFGPKIRLSEKDILRTIHGHGPGDNVIGVGAKSVVYRGVLPGGEMFAVKVLPSHGQNENMDNEKWDRELLREVHILGKLRHRNVLKVLGVCSTSNVKAIILEYMPQGSLHKHLYPLEGSICELTWQTRFNIAFGTAEGLTYLHRDLQEPVVHLDLKPSNILLDANLDAKVSDFGISKFADASGESEATGSKVCGTIGYMPPEYAMGTSVSTRGDVYTYGIVLLELITGKPPTCVKQFGPGGDLRGWVMDMFQDSPIELLDSTLMHESKLDSVKREQMFLVIRLALLCIKEMPQTRPSMSDVLVTLTEIKKLGLLPVTPRRIEELADDDSKLWTTQDLNNARLPSV